MTTTPDEKALKELIKRRHPLYEEMLPHWEFLEATYHGGREWFEPNLFQYVKEGDTEFGKRVERAYRFNHTREVVNLVNKYLFKGEVKRNKEDASDEVEAFWKSATRDGVGIDEFMRLADRYASILGRIWIFTDTTATPDVRTMADQKARKDKVYAYIVKAQNVLDVGYDKDGEPLWTLTYEEQRDDEDPFNSSGNMREMYRLWTRNEWMLLEATGSGNRRKVEIVDQGVNRLGIVPGFPLDNMGHSESPYASPALINDIAYLDRAVANYLSNLDAIIQDQTFSQLAMPAQGVSPGTDSYDKLIELGTKRIFLYDGEGGAQPHYLSPDPKQAELIVMVVKTIINEIYHTVGMAGERTKQDNALGIDNSSGVAKAYDFERVNSLLVTKAAVLARAENKLLKLVQMWLGEVDKDEPINEKMVQYPRDFDIRGIYDEMDLAQRLALLFAPDEVQQEQMKVIAEKLFPSLAQDLKTKMAAAITSWSSNQSVLTQNGVGADDKDSGKKPTG